MRGSSRSPMTWIHNPPHTPNPSDATTDLHSSNLCVMKAYHRCVDYTYVAVNGTVQPTGKITEHWNFINVTIHMLRIICYRPRFTAVAQRSKDTTLV